MNFPRFPLPPPRLARLYTDDTREATYFRKHIRKFNAGMAMSSLTVNDATVRASQAAFKVYGQMHRRIGPMLQNGHSTGPTCIQTYFYDPDYQVRYRVSQTNTQN